MSRITFPGKDPNHTVAVGLDHAYGFFLQVFSKDKDEPIIDIETRGLGATRVSRGEILRLLELHAEPSPKLLNALTKIAGDLDPTL